MKQGGDDVNGRHSFWTHFFCGLVIGGAVGVVIGYQFFDRMRYIAATALVAGGTMAWAAGRWGDRAWEEAMNILFFWFFY